MGFSDFGVYYKTFFLNIFNTNNHFQLLRIYIFFGPQSFYNLLERGHLKEKSSLFNQLELRREDQYSSDRNKTTALLPLFLLPSMPI